MLIVIQPDQSTSADCYQHIYVPIIFFPLPIIHFTKQLLSNQIEP